METTQNDTVQSYLIYVMAQLEAMNQSEAVASYDTGYGLHITNVSLGDECHSMDVRWNSIGKIRPPRIENFDTWEMAWNEARRIVRQFCAQVPLSQI